MNKAISGAKRRSAFSHLLNLDKYDMYFISQMLQQLSGIVHPIHVKCQSRQATTRDLNMWIQELASALNCGLDTFAKELFAKNKVQALGIKISLPAVPRVRRAFTAQEVEEFYVNLFKKAFEAAANFLLRHYQLRLLPMSDFSVVF